MYILPHIMFVHIIVLYVRTYVLKHNTSVCVVHVYPCNAHTGVSRREI